MEIVLGILVGVFAIAGILLLIKANKKENKKMTPEKQEGITTPADGCCGAHEICEFDKLKMNEKIIEYFEDEELDKYKTINEDAYSNEQIDQFRDILYTLKTNEIKNWLLSLERREIQLPSILKSEARMLINEA